MEGRELPVGWASIELIDAGIWGSGGTPSRINPRYYENGSIPWLVIGDLNDQAVEEFSTSITELGLINSSAKLIPTGSLLVAMYGSIGKLGITTFPCTTNQAIAFCVPNEELVELRYLFHALANAKPELIAKGQGGAQQNISQGILKEHLIPLSPLNEQRRIAAKLDTPLAAVEACRQRLDGVAAILKRFRRAVLAAATSGELTREWREERGIEDREWSTIKTREAGRVQLGRQRSPKYHSGPTMRPYLRVQNIFEDCIDLSDVMEMDFSGADLQRYLLHPGDILLNEGQSPQYLGRPAMYRGQVPGEVCFTNSLIRFQAGDSVLPEFALLVFRHYMHSGRYVSEGTITTNIAHLSAGRFGEVEFPLPSPDEQAEIVRRAQELFTLADQLEAKLSTARRIVDRLTPALLAKAFRGELVPQDPSEEPASELLERIRAARQAEATAGKPSRRGRRKAASNPESIALEAAPVPPNLLCALLQECGALSERALLAASELEPGRFRRQLEIEIEAGRITEALEEGERVLVGSACER